MEKQWVDFNCDVGEGIGNEAQLFLYISSCNIACGGHVGDEISMIETIKMAMHHEVKVGAHPSYPDKENFGRKVMPISADKLRESLLGQLTTFQRVATRLGAVVFHIKPHGALYNQMASDSDLAILFLEVIKESGLPRRIYAQYGSQIASLAEKNGVEVLYEAFADRNYLDDGSLVPRSNTDALISEPSQVLKHVLTMIKEGEVIALSQNRIKIKADTICIHGDTPTALEILQYLSSELPKYHIALRK
ncbi:5-oxoprolinase subunit PxpA [Flagellimonas sp.]|uniref:5-oxoprolinase subunit PxpA n=1 Tax=Flagellimonas sp. TaxID=2058762 RepID=UPI003F4A30FD